MEEHLVVGVLYESHPSALLLESIITDTATEPGLREAAFNHPGMDDEAARQILSRSRDNLRDRLVAATTRDAILRPLAASPDADIRASVAFNPATSVDLVLLLAADAEESVRSNAVYNPRLPLDTVRAMAAQDPSEYVRESAEDALTTSLGWHLRQGHRWATVSDEDASARVVQVASPDD